MGIDDFIMKFLEKKSKNNSKFYNIKKKIFDPKYDGKPILLTEYNPNFSLNKIKKNNLDNIPLNNPHNRIEDSFNRSVSSSDDDSEEINDNIIKYSDTSNDEQLENMIPLDKQKDQPISNIEEPFKIYPLNEPVSYIKPKDQPVSNIK